MTCTEARHWRSTTSAQLKRLTTTCCWSCSVRSSVSRASTSSARRNSSVVLPFVLLLLLLLLHPFNGLFSRTAWVSRHQKGKPFWILLEQEMMGWQWHQLQLDHMQIICTSFQTDNHASTSPLSFYRPDALPAAQPTASWICLRRLVLWHWWLGIRKTVWPVKNQVMRCWYGYLSGARCKWFAYGPADGTATPSSLTSLKSVMV